MTNSNDPARLWRAGNEVDQLITTIEHPRSLGELKLNVSRIRRLVAELKTSDQGQHYIARIRTRVDNLRK